jgi:hypothetical protein
LNGVKDGSGNSLVHGRKCLSSHLKPFKNGRDSQFGFDVYDLGVPATDQRGVKSSSGKSTLLFGKIDASESGFGKDRVFIKLERMVLISKLRETDLGLA